MFGLKKKRLAIPKFKVGPKNTKKYNLAADFKFWKIIEYLCIYTYSFNFYYVRLNLFNHVLALFCAKFACNLAIKYPVFRWELCKGRVWESMKKTQDVCTQEKPRDWISRIASHQRQHMCEVCRGAEGTRQLEHYRKKLPV